jgi:DNA-binding FrmR family transcriptional regulator
MSHRQHEHTEAVIKRLSRIEGHVSGIKKMVVDYKDCDQILIQISAVRSALNEVGKIILDDHMKQCVLEDIREGKTDSYENLKKAIDQYMK